MKEIKLAIVDDDEVLCIALMKLFRTQKDINLVIVAVNGSDLLNQLDTVQPDIILMDIKMPYINGVDATKDVFKLYPSIKILVYTNYDLDANILKMYTLGVHGFITKSSDTTELMNAIRAIHSTGSYMTDETFSFLRNHIRKRKKIR